ncbi:pentapeptide repeat-containing protein [Oscillatoria sp. CS-180]|uniref:pentapeptide repeat-containing protein n=1 Tax=Oscillatoria sp. CS-180 TaxID=3021720 RepID=UPI00232F886C|nr:pentapeptide repeat-containing protein [Oscillatoria sp. CS-180]MDB9527047.1 pentapeptide repeat-containing protein [Oscillatoria sp. CS-180]
MKIRNILVMTPIVFFFLPNGKMAERVALHLTKRCTNCLLSWQEFVRTDLSGADLRNTNFKGSRFVNVDLSEADLRGANFEDAYFEAVNMKDANLCGAFMVDGQKSPIGCWKK